MYVADGNDRRISEFTKEGTFLLAFGWGVLNGKAEPQTCTAATGCQEGLYGFGVGQFGDALSIAVDNSGGPSEGDVYVSEAGGSYRVQKFNPEGKFELLFGPDVTLSGPDNHTNDLQQTLTITATSGLLNLCFEVQCVTGLRFNASAATVQSELDALATIGGVGGSVNVSGGPGGSNPYVITFGGSFAGGDVPLLSATTFVNGIEVGKSVRSGGGPEVCKPASGDTCQAGSPDSGAGGFSEDSELPVAVGSSGEVWVGDLERAEQFSSAGAFMEDVALAGAGTLPALAVENGLAGDFYTLRASQDEEQKILLPPAGTPFTLSFEGQTTAQIKNAAGEELGAVADAVRAELEKLSTIGAGNILVAGFEGHVEIGFVGALHGADLPAITISAGSVAIVRAGVSGKVFKYNRGGTELSGLDEGGSPNALGIDPASGDLFVSDQDARAGQTASLLEYGPSGAFLEELRHGRGPRRADRQRSRFRGYRRWFVCHRWPGGAVVLSAAAWAAGAGRQYTRRTGEEHERDAARGDQPRERKNHIPFRIHQRAALRRRRQELWRGDDQNCRVRVNRGRSRRAPGERRDRRVEPGNDLQLPCRGDERQRRVRWDRG